MKILAIDTSTKFLSVAIAEDGAILAAFRDGGELKHSSLLIPVIDKLLKECGLKLKDIGAIALSIGPGSFTGLRIGVATCKGINMALGIPLIAVPTLDAVAYNFIDAKEDILCPLIDAKKQKLYACFYKKPDLRRVTDYMLIDVDSLLAKIVRPTLVFGDGIKIYGEECKKNPFVAVSTKDWFPKGEVVAKIGLAMAKKRQFANPDKLAPLYLHSKYCQIKGYKG